MTDPTIKKWEQNSQDSKLVNAFLLSTIKSLKVNCNFKITPAKAHMLNPSDHISADLIGIIGLTSKVFQGSITLCFSESLILSAVGAMFNKRFEAISDEFQKGVNELLRGIFDQAKALLAEQGIEIEKATPTVVHDRRLNIHALTGGKPTIVVPFITPEGKLHVLISLGHNEAPQRVPQPEHQKIAA
jgi:CheY-specific phosphatase CheX